MSEYRLENGTIYNEDGYEVVPEYRAEELYEDMLDDVYGVVSVAGYLYDTSRLLKEVDPIAFRVGFNDYCDSQEWEVVSATEYDKLETELEEANA